MIGCDSLCAPASQHSAYHFRCIWVALVVVPQQFVSRRSPTSSLEEPSLLRYRSTTSPRRYGVRCGLDFLLVCLSFARPRSSPCHNPYQERITRFLNKHISFHCRIKARHWISYHMAFSFQLPSLFDAPCSPFSTTVALRRTFDILISTSIAFRRI